MEGESVATDKAGMHPSWRIQGWRMKKVVQGWSGKGTRIPMHVDNWSCLSPCGAEKQSPHHTDSHMNVQQLSKCVKWLLWGEMCLIGMERNLCLTLWWLICDGLITHIGHQLMLPSTRDVYACVKKPVVILTNPLSLQGRWAFKFQYWRWGYESEKTVTCLRLLGEFITER